MPKITKSLVDKSPPRDKEYIVWDDQLKGFGLRVTPKGVKTYLIKYRAQRRRGAVQRKISIGRHGALTPDEARREAKRLLGAVARDEDPAKDRAEAQTAARFDEFATRYMRDHAKPKKKASSADEDQRLLDRVLIPYFGKRLIAEIGPGDINKLHASMSDRRTSANRCLSLLSKMFNLAEAWAERPRNSNPCVDVAKYPENKRERFLSPDELARLAKAINEAERDGLHPHGIAVLRLLVMTGARKGEILSLRWDEVDANHAIVLKRDSKTGRKGIPISMTASEFIQRLPRDSASPWVFPAAHGDSHYQGLTKVWLDVRKRADLEDVRIHDLRHTFASLAVGGGASLPVIGRILGHTQTQTTQRYAHLADDPVRRVIEATSDSLGSAFIGEDKDGEE